MQAAGKPVPTPEESVMCGRHLQTQIMLINPMLIVLLGNTPTRWMLQTTEGITKLRGRWFEWRGAAVMPMFHPSYLLRNASSKEGSPKASDLIDIQEVKRQWEAVSAPARWIPLSSDKSEMETTKKLEHVAIIMDGNGRWAKSRGLPRVMGHHAGVKAVERTVRAAKELGIPYLSLYAFSTENWKRPRGEVLGLMGLFRYYLRLYTYIYLQGTGSAALRGRADGAAGGHRRDTRRDRGEDEGIPRHAADNLRQLRRAARNSRRGEQNARGGGDGAGDGRDASKVSLSSRRAGPGSDYTHERRAATLELLALAERVQRILFHR